MAEKKPTNEDCLSCHSDSTLSKEVNGQKVRLYVDGDKLTHSIHGGMFTCVDCHKDVKGLVHSTTPKKISCVDCHSEAQQAYTHSLHSRATKTGARQLPGLPRRRARDCGRG
jgi:nitrate/TMAO reductase-like tetraheme cytochrome c subunit